MTPTGAAATGAPPRASAPAPAWVSWLLGLGVLAAAVTGALHYSEERAFVRLLERAEPWWLAAGVGFQLGTYVAQGGIWRRVARACGFALSGREAFELSLAKLFVDQALPSAGVSSGILVATALGQRELPAPAVKAAVLINVASYHLAYAIALLAAVAVVGRRGLASPTVVAMAVAFVAFSLALSAVVLALAGRPQATVVTRLHRVPALRSMLDYVTSADGHVVRALRLQVDTTLLQGAIVVLDAATVWVLLAALGERASMVGSSPASSWPA